jgi:polyhydroxybutyrate depolymerase
MREIVELYRSRRPAALHHGGLLGVLAASAIALLAAGPARAAPTCAGLAQSGTETRCESLQHDGRGRTYRIYVPARVAPAAPLLLVLHGGGGGGGGMEVLTAHGFNRRADEIGAIIVYPDGIGHGWNDGRRDLRSRAVKDQVDDVGFLRALVDTLERRYPIDRARVFVTGISNGGMMTLRLACEARDVFKGFVAVAASLGEDVAGSCNADGIERVALIDGTADPIVPWGGGPVAVLGATRGRVIGAKASFDFFMAAAKCGTEHADPPLDRVADDGTQLTLHTAGNCVGGAEVRLYEIDGGGHAWPGGLRYARERLIGKVSRELDATDETWRFLGLAAGTSAGPV